MSIKNIATFVYDNWDLNTMRLDVHPKGSEFFRG